MSIRSDCIRRPISPVARDFVPQGSIRYKVQDQDSWEVLAQRFGASAAASFDPWYLIRFNYPNLPRDNDQASLEVNWYLREYVGCKVLTEDRRNYRFSSSASPGYIYLPNPEVKSPLLLSAPILTGIKERREAIMANTPAIFVVDPDPSAKPNAEPWYSIHRFSEVGRDAQLIELAAFREGLDPDFVKAIVWMETTHGYYDRVDPWNKTIRPMNVHYKLWSELGISRDAVKNSSINVAAGTRILAAIWERTQDPTPEKVATLYNKLGATKVDGYGKAVAQYMKFKPWLRQPQ
jgi:hypothetical protein